MSSEIDNTSQHSYEQQKRAKSILSTLDEVHRSLLFKNLQFDETKTEIKNRKFQSFQKTTEMGDFQPRRFSYPNESLYPNVGSQSQDDESIKYYKKNHSKCRLSLDQRNSNRNLNVNKKIKICDCRSKNPAKRDYETSSNSSQQQRTISRRSSTFTNSSSESTEYIECTLSEERAFRKSKLKNSENGRKSIDSPMIQIVQEITEQRTVTSTVQINRKKARQFGGQCTIVRSRPVKRRKCREKVDRENVQNEILAQTNPCDHRSFDGDGEHDTTAASTPNNERQSLNEELESEMRTGRLEAANCRTLARPVGRLMTKRLEREKQKRQSLISMLGDENGNRIPPIKPPRTFAASPKHSSDTSTTIPIEEIQSKTPSKKIQSSKFGWSYEYETRMASPKVSVEPSCPTLDDISKIEWLEERYGWIKQEPNREPNEIYNMLNYDQKPCKKSAMTSFNLVPQPQIGQNIPPKLSIDTVDSSATTFRGQRTLDRFPTESVFSTPVKQNELSSKSVPEIDSRKFDEETDEYCKNCQLKIEPKPVGSNRGKTTFRKNALKRTKSFFRASKRKIVASKRLLNPKNGLTDTEDYQSPAKSETTEQMNKSMNESVDGKRSTKNLGFTPQHFNESREENTLESAEQSIVKCTPPVKPIRKNRRPLSADATKQKISAADFDFNRKITSPTKQKQSGDDQQHGKRRFVLSPKRLFKTLHKSTGTEKMTEKSYCSYVEHDDDFLIFMGEYLQRMQRKIEGQPATNGQTKRLSKVERDRVSMDDKSLEGIKTISTSSNELENDLDAAEPIYAEIQNGNLTMLQETPPSRYMANDDPKAIYSFVNKTPQTSADINSGFLIGRPVSSEESDSDLNLGNTLSVSIGNLLGFMQSIQNENTDDSSLAQPTKIEHSVLLHKAPPSVCDQISCDTFLTEELCHDVGCGDGINQDIANVITRLENLDPMLECREFKKAVHDSESSDTSSSIKCDDPNEIGECSFDSHRNTNRFETIDRYSDHGIDVVDHPIGPTQPEPLQKPTSHFKSPNFKNLTTKLRNSFNRNSNNSRSKQSTDENLSQTVRNPSDDDYRLANILKLTTQISFQCEIRNQLKKAIEMCRNSKELERSAELVEAERLMLLSYKKEQCAKYVLEQMTTKSATSPGNRSIEPIEKKCCATISITDIEIPLKSIAMYDTYFNYFYICVFSYRDQAMATATQERQPNMDRVRFSNLKNILFEMLEPDFQIDIEIFVLRMHKHAGSVEWDNGGKINAKKNEKLSPILSPVRAFVAKTKIDSTKSKFRFQGKTQMTTDCLSSSEYVENRRNLAYGENKCLVYFSSITKSFQLYGGNGSAIGNGLDKTNLSGEPITIGYDSEIRLINVGLKGYLNVAEGCEQYWSRKWAVIDGCGVYFWDNQDEQPNTEPNLSIDLSKCATEYICLADKKTCAMPMTLIIDITDERHKSLEQQHIDHTIETIKLNRQRYFIGTNNNTELIQWLTELNRILEFIRDWNI